MVEPDGLAGRGRDRLGQALLEQLAELIRDVCDRIVEADRVRVAGEEPRVALLVALPSAKTARCSATPASPTQNPATSSDSRASATRGQARASSRSEIVRSSHWTDAAMPRKCS